VAIELWNLLYIRVLSGARRGLETMSDSSLSSEINKRRTFAIISHPDLSLKVTD